MLPWLQRKLLFPSHLVPRPRHAAHAEVGGEQYWFDGVEAWLLPGRGVTAATPGPLLVFAHGNGELIDQWPPMLAPYRQRGLSVLLPEYRGYGRSAGQPSEPALVGDFARALTTVIRAWMAAWCSTAARSEAVWCARSPDVTLRAR
jgi:pimeloyl-ACP methyl ester carboxylesterase